MLQLPGGVAVWTSLVAVVATISVGWLYLAVNKQHPPLKGFPLASIDGHGPILSWMLFGRRLLDESLEKVRVPRWQDLQVSLDRFDSGTLTVCHFQGFARDA